MFRKNDNEREIMGWQKFYITVVSVLAGLFLFSQQMAFSSDAYFSPQEIKKHLLLAIEECRESIDIAVQDINSKDLLNALSRAQERGVNIRIVAGRKHALWKGHLSDSQKSRKFLTKVFIQTGLMHNNFAIFDCKLLITGSYYWNDRVRKPNRENALFTNETGILVKYQREFDRLFHEALIPDVREVVPDASQNTGKRAEGPPGIAPKLPSQEKQVVVSNYGIVITETPDGYIDMNFEKFNEIFGVASDLTEEQRDVLWSRCTGKKVRWKGTAKYIGWGLMTGWIMNVTHGDTSVEVKLDPVNKAHFSSVHYGSTVTYTGKLDTRVTKIFPYTLEKGDVLGTEKATPNTPEDPELILNPYIVPVSQGPKKIFIIESFADLDTVFGKESKLSDSQKEEAWKKYEGKYASWEGRIAYKNLNAGSGLLVGIKNKETCDMELKFGLSKKDKVLKFHEGETILYTGRLTTRCGENSPYILEDGDIMTLK